MAQDGLLALRGTDSLHATVVCATYVLPRADIGHADRNRFVIRSTRYVVSVRISRSLAVPGQFCFVRRRRHHASRVICTVQAAIKCRVDM